MIFDLDPDPEERWEDVIDGAAEVRERMAEFGLTSFSEDDGRQGPAHRHSDRTRIGWPAIKGFTESDHAGRGFRSLLLGYYEDDQLQFAGKIGTGFNQDICATT